MSTKHDLFSSRDLWRMFFVGFAAGFAMALLAEQIAIYFIQRQMANL